MGRIAYQFAVAILLTAGAAATAALSMTAAHHPSFNTIRDLRRGAT